ncbi:MAG: DUF2461 domain-containing protein [Acidobacteriota bacterium]
MPLRNNEELPPFSGIPRQGLTFLKQLEKNNNRDWFLEHKREFEQSLLLPMRSLVAALRDILAPVAPSLRIDPIKSIHRIYRDIRFSKDKSPYKTHLAAGFGHTANEAGAGLYLHISAQEAATGGGQYMPSPEQLRSIRQAIAADGPSFIKIVQDQEIKRRFGALRGEKLQRPPLGFAADHPMLDYLRFKQFYFIRDYQADDCLKSTFVKDVAEDYLRLLPFIDWLRRSAKTA